MKRLAIPIALCAALAMSTLAGGTALAQVYGQQGYGQQSYGNVPAGSYQQSCNNIRVRGNGLLTANCANNSGQRVRSQLAYQSCQGADIGNINGQLSCVRSGNYYGRGHGRHGDNRGGRYGNGNNGYNNGALPSGSYQQSCNNASMNGSTLSANCRNNSGAYMTSYLDVTQCRSTDDIGNLNGQLRCIYRY